MASFADKMSAGIDVRRAWEEHGVDAAELRALQEPIKQTYRDNPERPGAGTGRGAAG